jgi:hypothetical protein
MIKPPAYAVQAIFYRIVTDCEEIKTSSQSLHCGRCPLCSDYKKRMYLKEYPDHYHIYCHNCGYSNNFMSFLKDEYAEYVEELKEYVIQSIRDGSFMEKKKVVQEVSVEDVRDEIDMKLRCYLQDNAFSLTKKQRHDAKELCRNKAISYLESRKIRENDWKDFFFFFDGSLKGYIGIPMWDEKKQIMLHIQGRLLIKSRSAEIKQEKYLFIKDTRAGIDNIPKPIYGLWKADKTQMSILSEGTLSALAFGKQGLSTCGANISKIFINKVKKQFINPVWSLDNYWIDPTGRKKTESLLAMGETCFIFPHNVTCKDTNDILTYMNWDIIPEDFIKDNLYTGKTGLAKLKIMNL